MASLNFDNRFIRELPGDPLTTNQTFGRSTQHSGQPLHQPGVTAATDCQFCRGGGVTGSDTD